MTRHSTGITPGYIDRVMYYQRTAERESIEHVKAEIIVLANELVGIYGKAGYDRIVDQMIPENAPWDKVKETFQWLLDQEQCHCVLPEQSCPRCRAAATADLEDGEIPWN